MIVVTGAAGFIGFHLSKRLINEGHQILGIDNLNNYYDVSLKKERLKILEDIQSDKETFKFIKCDLEDSEKTSHEFVVE